MPPPTPESALKTTQRIAGALAAGVLLATGIAAYLATPGASTYLGLPLGLAGLVSPVIGYRCYLWMRERIPAGAAEAPRLATFQRATVSALAITESVALLGVVGFLLGGGYATLFGALTHVLLTGAIWPVAERLEIFLDPALDGRGGSE